MKTRPLAAVLCVCLLAGCGEGDAPPAADPSPVAPTVGAPAAGDTGARADVSPESVEFVRLATMGHLLAIQSSQLIVDKEVGGEEQAFAESVIAEHTKANQELARLAESLGIRPPAELDEEYARELEALKGLSGEALAEAYHKHQQAAHDQAVHLFENAAKNLSDERLRALAARTLPVLQSHREKLGAHHHHH